MADITPAERAELDRRKRVIAAGAGYSGAQVPPLAPGFLNAPALPIGQNPGLGAPLPASTNPFLPQASAASSGAQTPPAATNALIAAAPPGLFPGGSQFSSNPSGVVGRPGSGINSGGVGYGGTVTGYVSPLSGIDRERRINAVLAAGQPAQQPRPQRSAAEIANAQAGLYSTDRTAQIRSRAILSDAGQTDLPAIAGNGGTSTSVAAQGGYSGIAARSQTLRDQNRQPVGFARASEAMRNANLLAKNSGSLTGYLAQTDQFGMPNPALAKLNPQVYVASRDAAVARIQGAAAWKGHAMEPEHVAAIAKDFADKLTAAGMAPGPAWQQGIQKAREFAQAMGGGQNPFVLGSGLFGAGGGPLPPLGRGGVPFTPVAGPGGAPAPVQAQPIAVRNPHLPPGYQSIDELEQTNPSYPEAKAFDDLANGRATRAGDQYMRNLMKDAGITGRTPESRTQFVKQAGRHGLPKEVAENWWDDKQSGRGSQAGARLGPVGPVLKWIADAVQ